MINHPPVPANTPELEALNRFLEKVDSGEVVIFTKLEAATLKKMVLSPDGISAFHDMVNFWVGFRTMGRFFTWLQRVLVYVGWGVGVYAAWRMGILDFIRGAKP